MIKKFIWFLILSSGFFISNAQLKQLAEGPGFDEPEEGYAKIIQMKNGNTVFVHISVSNGINVRVYDPKYIEKAAVNSSTSYDKLQWNWSPNITRGEVVRTEDVYGIFEINNDVVIYLGKFISNGKKNIYKIVVDGTTGKLKMDEIVAKMQYGSFMVKKDCLTDNYVISISGKLESNTEYQNNIIVFGSDHKEIRRITLKQNPELDNDHKSSWLTDILVINGKLYAFFFAFKNSKGGVNSESKGNTFMAVSENGTSFSNNYIQLKFPTDMPVWGNGIKYNPVTKKIYVFTQENNNKEAYKRSYKYNMYFTVIDPETKATQTFGEVGTNQKINDAYRERFSKKEDYLGMAQDLYINNDGGFSLICEERMMGGVDADNTWIGKILQSNYDKDGNFKSGFIIPKFHKLFKIEQLPFLRQRSETTAQTLHFGSQYKFFIYLDGTENKYLLFNDVERNNDVKGDKYTAVAGLNDCDTYIYKLMGTELVPERRLAFNSPKSGGHNMAMLSVSDYDKKNNILVTLLLDKKNKTVKLVWVQPQ